MTRFTIVSPSLNQGKFLEQTIKSVLDQKGDFFIDYIVADGGSTDNSVNIIKKYFELTRLNKYPIKCKGVEFRWWSKKDKGQTNALNMAFREAKGDVCAWINSDDFYAPGALDFIADKFAKNEGVDLIYGDTTEIMPDGSILAGKSFQSDFKKNLEEGCIISQQSAFFKKRALINVGYLDESFDYCMDYDLWMKILKKGKAKYYKKNLAYFRIWKESKTSKYKKNFFEEENIIRKKYGGSFINPGSIHRFSKRNWLLRQIKKNFPKIYYFFKKFIYRFINIFKTRE